MAQYQGKQVSLNKPFRESVGGKKYAVYVRNKNGNIVKVRFGDANSTVKNNDDGARKSFLARHNCSEKTDKTTPGYWACRIGSYAKSVGLASGKPW